MRSAAEAARGLRRIPGTRLEAELAGDGLLVRLPGGRSQRIRIEEQDGRLVLSSAVAPPSALAHLSDREIAEILWRRNRETDVVAFSLDPRSRLVGRIEQPSASAGEDEIAFYLARLALECDRLEFLLTGRDEG